MGVTFGTEDDIICITDVGLKGANEEPLCLAYKITIKHFIGPVYLHDDGLVLRVKFQDSYYDLPEPEQLKEFQEAGLLPTPLPSYEIPWWRYGYGYLLWIVIAGVAITSVIAAAVKKAKAARATPPPPHVTPPE